MIWARRFSRNIHEKLMLLEKRPYFMFCRLKTTLTCVAMSNRCNSTSASQRINASVMPFFWICADFGGPKIRCKPASISREVFRLYLAFQIQILLLPLICKVPQCHNRHLSLALLPLLVVTFKLGPPRIGAVYICRACH